MINFFFSVLENNSSMIIDQRYCYCIIGRWSYRLLINVKTIGQMVSNLGLRRTHTESGQENVKQAVDSLYSK